jgi:hypothetical protein
MVDGVLLAGWRVGLLSLFSEVDMSSLVLSFTSSSFSRCSAVIFIDMLALQLFPFVVLRSLFVYSRKYHTTKSYCTTVTISQYPISLT